MIVLPLSSSGWFVIVAIIIGAYNGLIRRRNQIENAWSQIDVQLKRRLDLIPNLVRNRQGLRRS